MAAGVAPQSSWILSPAAPARICSTTDSGIDALPLPSSPMLTGRVSADWSIRAMFQAPGVHVVPLVPSAGPVPPPKSVVTPLESASSTCCGARKWMWVSMPPAVTIVCSPEITSVPGPMTSAGSTPSCRCGLPALPTPTIRPSRTPMSPLTTPSTGSRTIAPVTTRSSAPDSRVAAGSCAMPSRIALPPP